MTPSASLQDLYRSHAIELLQFARRRVGTQEAEDVVQDAYLHLLQHKTDEPIGNARAYLFRVTANAAIDQMRKSKTRNTHQASEGGDPDALDNARALAPEPIFAWRLRAALDKLPVAQRQVFLLNRIEGLTYPEIAARLGLSVRTVDRHLLKALTVLKEQLAET